MSYEQSHETAPGGEPPAAEPPRNALTDSAFGRLAGVLVSPTATFRSIARRPTWVAAFVLISLVVAAAQFVAVSKLDTSGVRDQIEQQLESRGQQMSDAELDNMVDLQMKIGAGCGVLFMPVLFLLAALVLMVAFRMLGGEVSYKGSLAVVVHAAVPLAIASLLGTLVLLARTTPLTVSEAQSGGVLASNLAFLAPEGASAMVVALLASIDLFSLWMVILLAIGFAQVAGVATSTAALTSFLLWAVLVAIRVGLAALGAAGSGGGG